MVKVSNFRDIGGLSLDNGKKIKQGLVYRSSHLDSIKKKDFIQLEKLNIKTIIDLRFLTEKNKNEHLSKFNIYNFPMDFDKGVKEQLKSIMFKRNKDDEISDIILNQYSNLVTEYKDVVKKVFEILANKDSYPLIIHCRAGKDRTGFIIALLLLTLNISENKIIEDYLLTNEFFLPKPKRTLLLMKIASLGFFYTKNIQYLLTAHKKNIVKILDTIKNDFGNVTNYLESCKINQKDIDLIKDILIEEV